MYAVCRSHLCIVNVREYEVHDTFPLHDLGHRNSRDLLDAILHALRGAYVPRAVCLNQRTTAKPCTKILNQGLLLG